MTHVKVVIDIHAEHSPCWQFVENIYELMQDFGDFASETNVCVVYDD